MPFVHFNAKMTGTKSMSPTLDYIKAFLANNQVGGDVLQ